MKRRANNQRDRQRQDGCSVKDTCLCSAAGGNRDSKILAYDGQGFWLAQKRLSQGRFGCWPEGGLRTR